MATIHFLNVLEGDCNIIQHDNGHITVIDVSNAYNDDDSPEEIAAKAIKDKEIKTRNFVPDGKINYNQKENPDNPVEYLNKLKIKDIFRFIITHPDMDHLDGIKDFYEEFTITNTWDSDNNKELNLKEFPNKFNPEDWKFYTQLRSGKVTSTKRLTYYAGNSNSYFKEDNIKILCPSPELVKQANKEGGDIHDLSYVLLFTFPKKGGGNWKVIFSGDSHDNSWDYILENFEDDVKKVDVLFAPHHGRDSNRSYEFLNTLNPKMTLFGNASSKHLAYDSYKGTRITNNQAGYVILDITEDRLLVLVKNKLFAYNYRNKDGKSWGAATYYKEFDAYGLFQYNAK
jgi:beta-lactamase superfamily II metal-dependent hydrolase